KGRYEPPQLPILALFPAFGKEWPKLEEPERTHLVRLVPPFGAVPEELEEIYPLGQFQVPRELDAMQIKSVAEGLSRFLERYGGHYERVLLFNEERRWGKSLVEACKDVRRKLEVIQL
ncbi:MAG: DUF5591 domain-containing protein, partial [Hadesarchaea archaeon]|nr:DUF5591 domain-containing protein [Hadesarchaea archaeon]